MDRLSDYDYFLPESAIAQTPLADRAASRLLVLSRETGRVEHRTFRDVVEILEPGDLLVLNDTRVTALRLFGNKLSLRTSPPSPLSTGVERGDLGAKVEALLLREESPGIYTALLKPGKRLRPGTRIEFEGGLVAQVLDSDDDGVRRIQFEGAAEPDIEKVGETPIPPYIHTRLETPERYQTVYASAPGSAAAPTAGLHFTEDILTALEAKGVKVAKVTLDVGIDTFRPVQNEDLTEHRMHGERCAISPEAAEAVTRCHGRIIAVGTTAVRTLESFATGNRSVDPGEKTTSIFIRPGYPFQVIDGMFTNFHMPRTTMLMMISALASRDSVFAAYEEALNEGYRFLSFGDSMLIL
ncbi:MAG: tRNA preQ1(34) S-adenosylmethionine ribosyltransferase-isomerase QueA [Fimbriimonadaceae bacterium]|nr:tRNA preQ1(34) S-adenosylmethionine ribosyltransferase-isomerase QueA [Fimbriimonadaceae bacterium]